MQRARGRNVNIKGMQILSHPRELTRANLDGREMETEKRRDLNTGLIAGSDFAIMQKYVYVE